MGAQRVETVVDAIRHTKKLLPKKVLQSVLDVTRSDFRALLRSGDAYPSLNRGPFLMDEDTVLGTVPDLRPSPEEALELVKNRDKAVLDALIDRGIVHQLIEKHFPTATLRKVRLQPCVARLSLRVPSWQVKVAPF